MHLDIINVLFISVDSYYCYHYFRTVQRTHTNKDPLIYPATSPHTDVF